MIQRPLGVYFVMCLATHDLAGNVPDAGEMIGKIVMPLGSLSPRRSRKQGDDQKEGNQQRGFFHWGCRLFRFAKNTRRLCRVEGGNSKEPPKTNAAQASHPGRIVIADKSDCRLSLSQKIIEQPAFRRMLCIDAL